MNDIASASLLQPLVMNDKPLTDGTPPPLI
jgi:hypothetical protein